MSWGAVRWLLRLAFVAAVAYGAWHAIAYYLGKHYFRRGMVAMAEQPGQATRMFSIAVRLQPRNARYRAALGRAALKQGRFSEAAVQLQKAARQRPNDFGIWYDLGMARLKSNSPALAIKAFQRALQIRPEAEAALAGLVEASTRTGDLAAAIAPLKQLWERSPTNVSLGAKLAAALITQSQYDEALQVCTRVRKVVEPPKRRELVANSRLTLAGEDWCRLLVAEGDAYCAKGQWAEAVIAYQRCLLIEPAYEKAVAGLEHLPDDLAQKVSTDFPVHAVSLSPNGRELALCGTELRVADLATRQVKRLAEIDGPGSPSAPAWSPDGRQLCYAKGLSLHLIERNGTKRVLMREPPPVPHLAKLGIPATFGSASVQGQPSWSPNSKAIAFAADLGQDVSLTFVVDVQTGSARCTHHTTGALPQMASSGFAPAWSPNSRVLCGPLAYKPQEQAPGLTLWSADGVVKRQVSLPREGVLLADARHAIVGVRWSPDGRYLAVLSRLADRTRTVLALVPVAPRKIGRVIAKDVIAFGWRDACQVWILQQTGETPVNAQVRELVADVRGNITLVQSAVPAIPFGVFEVSADGSRLVTLGPPATGGRASAIWVFHLGKLRRARG